MLNFTHTRLLNFSGCLHVHCVCRWAVSHEAILGKPNLGKSKFVDLQLRFSAGHLWAWRMHDLKWVSCVALQRSTQTNVVCACVALQRRTQILVMRPNACLRGRANTEARHSGLHAERLQHSSHGFAAPNASARNVSGGAGRPVRRNSAFPMPFRRRGDHPFLDNDHKHASNIQHEPYLPDALSAVGANHYDDIVHRARFMLIDSRLARRAGFLWLQAEEHCSKPRL